MALTKADLAKSLHKLGVSRTEATLLVDDFFEIIRLALEQGEEVKLSGLGSFRTRDKRQRPGRNPKTGEQVPVKARRVVTFQAGQKLKEKICEKIEKG